jgi:molecular chaperone HscB
VSIANNFFEIFSLPISWEIDANALNKKFRALQLTFHPDRYANKNDFEKRLAVQTASTINQAYETLSSPLLRAQYLLKLEGFDADQESHVTSDGQFLMQQMLLREALSDAKDSADPKQALVSLSIEAQQAAAKIQTEFAQYFNAKDYSQAFDTLAKMQFACKFVDDISNLEQELEEL